MYTCRYVLVWDNTNFGQLLNRDYYEWAREVMDMFYHSQLGSNFRQIYIIQSTPLIRGFIWTLRTMHKWDWSKVWTIILDSLLIIEDTALLLSATSLSLSLSLSYIDIHHFSLSISLSYFDIHHFFLSHIYHCLHLGIHLH